MLESWSSERAQVRSFNNIFWEHVVEAEQVTDAPAVYKPILHPNSDQRDWRGLGQYFATAEPNPPTMEAFSADTAQPVLPAELAISSLSIGLMEAR